MNFKVYNSIVRRQLDLVEDLYVNDMLVHSQNLGQSTSRMLTRLFTVLQVHHLKTFKMPT